MAWPPPHLGPLLAVGLFASLAGTLGACGQGGGSSSTQATKAGMATATSHPTAPSAEGSGRGAKSLLPYGAAGSGAERRAVEGAALSYFTEFAAREYSKVCGDLSAANREDLTGPGRSSPHSETGCAEALKALIGRSPIIAAGHRAAGGKIEGIRVKGGTAFVLFRPSRGQLSYFAMKREGGAWKAISLAPGAPLSIPARR